MPRYSDSPRYRGLRRKLADELRRMGIADARVLAAIEKLPRHLFVDSVFAQQVHQNRAFGIGQGQTMSHPYTVAWQTELLQLEAGEKVLEIGTGSGYQACVLLELGAEVHTIERFKSLHQSAVATFKKLGYFLDIYSYFGDGYAGLPQQAPFDKIIVTAAAPQLPQQLIGQLKNGGRMVVPVGAYVDNHTEDQQIMTLVEKGARGKVTVTELGSAAFVPMLPGKRR